MVSWQASNVSSPILPKGLLSPDQDAEPSLDSSGQTLVSTIHFHRIPLPPSPSLFWPISGPTRTQLVDPLMFITIGARGGPFPANISLASVACHRQEEKHFDWEGGEVIGNGIHPRRAQVN